MADASREAGINLKAMDPQACMSQVMHSAYLMAKMILHHLAQDCVMDLNGFIHQGAIPADVRHHVSIGGDCQTTHSAGHPPLGKLAKQHAQQKQPPGGQLLLLPLANNCSDWPWRQGNSGMQV